MSKYTNRRVRAQDDKAGEAADQFREYLRQSIRDTLWELMQEEVEQLCGRRHERGRDAEHRRAGSERGVFYTEGGKQVIDRPRVRRQREDGNEEEVRLTSYAQARSRGNIEQEIYSRMSEGVSTRGCARLSGKTISASTASRLWVEGSIQKLEELRGRDLAKEEFIGLMVDGVFLGRELVVVVALGITCAGEKRMLDFTVGSTENYEVVKELIVRLRQRGFSVEDRRLLTILDGAKALRKAIKEFWPDAVVQNCLVHQERNLYRYLPKRDHPECRRLLRRLRLAQGPQAAREALAELRRFVAARNAAALASLDESGEELIALHLLDVPATLNTSLLSTNLIENAIHNYRRQTQRVTRWQPKTDQVDRWSATALLWVERGFNKIVGHADLPKLRAALTRPTAVCALAAGCVADSTLRVAVASATDALHPTGSDPLHLTSTP